MIRRFTSGRVLSRTDILGRRRRWVRGIGRRPLAAPDAAYIAGILDGEGWLGASKVVDPKVSAGFYIRPQVAISMTTDVVFEWLKTLHIPFWNGKCVLRERPDFKPNWKNVGQLSLSGNAIRWLLPQVIPYMHVKRHQAELVLVLAERGFERQHSGLRERKSPEEQVRIYRELRQLNRRGK